MLAVVGVVYFVVAQSGATETPVARPTATHSGSTHHGTTGHTPTGRTAALRNPLYSTPKTAGLPCHAPQLNTHSERSMGRFLKKVSDCLDTTWAKRFKAAHIPFRPPTRVYWTRPGTSPCGNYPAPGAAAFYCGANHAMYIGLNDVVKNSGNAPGRYYSIYISVLAHEYGHHVQSAAGILTYGHRAETEAGGTSKKNEISRRIELQANCFDGVYLDAVGDTLPMTGKQKKLVVVDAYYRGDRPGYPPDHGSKRHFRNWLIRGMKYGKPGKCNTWGAGDTHVS